LLARGEQMASRRSFTMRLKPGGLADYKKHHDAIWPELVAEIERCGIRQITIFEADPILVVYSEIDDDDAWDRLWASEVHGRWGKIMDALLEMGDNGAPEVAELSEVFHVETGRS
jgi:L-rhamnose mutarotase